MLAISSPLIDWHAFAPELVLVAGAIAILIVDLFLKKRSAATLLRFACTKISSTWPSWSTARHTYLLH